MAKNTNFSKLVEYIIADDHKKAKALFHQIVVNKSRKIYESLEMDEASGDAFDDVEADELAGHGENPGPIEDGEFADEHGGDEADDFEDDVFSDEDNNDEFGDHDGLGDDVNHEEDFNANVDDRVSDLEAQYDELKAEFEQLLHAEDEEVEDEEGEDEGLDAVEDEVEDDDFDSDEDAADEFEDEEEVEDEDEDLENEDDESSDDDDFEDEEDDEKVDESVIREYVDKVTKGLSNDSEESFVNKKSTVAGKNEIVKGVGPGNIATGKGGEKGRPTPTSKPMSNDKFQNVPGAKTRLSAAPKPDRTKEREGTGKKSPIA